MVKEMYRLSIVLRFFLHFDLFICKDSRNFLIGDSTGMNDQTPCITEQIFVLNQRIASSDHVKDILITAKENVSELHIMVMFAL